MTDTVAGKIDWDFSQNHWLDPREPGIQVMLQRPDGGEFTITDGNEMYQFQVKIPGIYTVYEGTMSLEAPLCRADLWTHRKNLDPLGHPV